MSQHPITRICDRWQQSEGPEADIVVSSRARLARNLTGHRFSRSASAEELDDILACIDAAVAADSYFKDFQRVVLGQISGFERTFLRESHLISPEMEHHGGNCAVYLSPDAHISIMINEEDHLRMQAIEPGFQIQQAYEAINAVDDLLGAHLEYAFSPKLGYLTACPTNTGTGLRASVMLHLPGLVLANAIEQIVKDIASRGFTVRGFYGEGTDSAGDIYQISNEVTLGKSEQEILENLNAIVGQIIDHEHKARRALFEQKAAEVEDSIWRSYGTLSQARIINSSEAIALLSRLRLGIDQGHFGDRFTHHDLNRLIIEIQPAHLIHLHGAEASAGERDIARADYLRRRLADIIRSN